MADEPRHELGSEYGERRRDKAETSPTYAPQALARRTNDVFRAVHRLIIQRRLPADTVLLEGRTCPHHLALLSGKNHGALNPRTAQISQVS